MQRSVYLFYEFFDKSNKMMGLGPGGVVFSLSAITAFVQHFNAVLFSELLQFFEKFFHVNISS